MAKILIVQADFYKEISAMLLEGAVRRISQAGYHHEIITVPGAFEIPAAIAMASGCKETFFKNYDKYQGYVALGCIIRGETSHYDYICAESARGLNDLATKDKLAIGYGIITCENEEQAIDRADLKKKNKGGFAAMACIEMIKLKKSLMKK